MSTATDISDYSQFKSWMSEFKLGADDETLSLRWHGVAKLVKELTVEDLETLVRLALKWNKPPAKVSIDRIAAYFSEELAFSSANNARELQVLAAIGLAIVANAQNHKLASAAALMIATSFVGQRKTNLPLDLAAIGDAALDTLSNGVGRRPKLAAMKYPQRFSFTASADFSQQNWDQAAAGIKNSVAAADAAVWHLATQLSTVTKVFERTLRQQDEELQMLWWLLGGKSEVLNMPFASMAGDGQALVLGAELAEHTVLPPGPASVATLLERAGLKSKGKVEVAKAIATSDQKWLATLAGGDMLSPVIFPIHFGIQRQLEVGAGNEWIANWSAVTGLKADWSLPPVALGKLFYRERLLRRAV